MAEENLDLRLCIEFLRHGPPNCESRVRRVRARKSGDNGRLLLSFRFPFERVSERD